MLGTPHFWNVVSNLPFIAIGAVGLWQFRRDPATIVLFLGILLTGFGSAYYHWNPNDRTLFWDRLPMALSFMAILAIAIEKRLNAKLGAVLLWPLIAIGVFSLLLWRWTGDLRLYVWVQFFPCLALPLLFVLFPPKYSGTSYWFVAAALYGLAKLLELYDAAIFSVGSLLSGHTLKHLAAAAACVAILKYFQTRKPMQHRTQFLNEPSKQCQTLLLAFCGLDGLEYHACSDVENCVRKLRCVAGPTSYETAPTFSFRSPRAVQLLRLGEELGGMSCTIGACLDAAPSIYGAGFRLQSIGVELAAAVIKMAFLTYQSRVRGFWRHGEHEKGRAHQSKQ